MPTKIEAIYTKWRNEFNKGHNKDYLSDWPDNPMSLFGNQDFIVDLYQEVFDHYEIKFEGKILDAGCSMGGLLFSLEKNKKFELIAGFDIDRSAVDMAIEYKELNNIQNVDIKCGSALKIPFDDNTFDIVLLKDVAEHLDNEDNFKVALNECNRVLKNDGLIFIEAPNYHFPYEPHLKMIKIPYYSNKRIIRFLAHIFKKNKQFVDQLNFTTPGMLKKQLSNTGFYSIIDIYDDYRLKWKIDNIKHSSTSNKLVDTVLTTLSKLRLSTLMILLLRKTRMYPILWFIARKR